MKDGWKSLALVLAGILLGACMKEIVASSAYAQAGHRYSVVNGSMSADGYEKDLNEKARDGWRYVGAIPHGNGPGKLVFEQ